MKRIHFLIGLLLILSTSLFSQEKKDTVWRAGGNGNIAFSQVALSNWSAGGENSFSTDLFLNLFAKYSKGKSSWDNNLKLAYGIVKMGEGQAKKSNDMIDFESKFGYAASKHWNYSIMYNYKTQFAEGYDYNMTPKSYISNFMAPGYMFLSLGMDYKPCDYFSLMLSPITSKNTFVLDNELSAAGLYGVKPGERIFMECGAFLKARFKIPVLKNVMIESAVDLFSAYTNKPQNIDVDWQMLIDMKINSYLSASIRTHLIYDDDVKILDKNGAKGSRVQFKETLGIGLNYRF